MPDNTQETDLRDAPSLLTDLLRQLKELVRSEAALAKREIKQNLSRAGGGLAMIGIAAILALVGLHVLAIAATLGLIAAGLAPWLAALIVGAVLLIVAAILFFAGRGRLDADALKPQRTMRNVQSDFALAREIRHD